MSEASAPVLTLKASKFATNSFLPPQLVIYPNRVEYRGKVSVGGQESTTIGMSQIANVAVKSSWGKASITIETTGGQHVTVEKVKLAEAKHAESVLNDYRFR